jgi:hypothetical protein
MGDKSWLLKGEVNYMRDAKSLNAWLREAGYTWVEGQERFYKASLTWVEAQALIEELAGEGAVERG